MGRRSEHVVAGAFALAVVALSWGLARLGGAIGIPRTDDWAYEIIARDLFHTGHVHLIGFGQMMLVGLAAWAQPWLWVFGDHRWVLQLSSSALFAVGLYGAQRLARVLLSFGESLFVVAGVAAYPGVLRDASSFMTDGPALGLHVLVLLAGLGLIRARPTRQLAWLLLVALLGFFAFSVRELTFAAPAAVVATAALAGERQLRRRALAVAAVLVVACAGLWAWRHSLPNGEPYNGPPSMLVLTLKVVGAALAVGLGLVPALALTWRRWWPARHRRARIIGALAGTAVVAVPVVIGRWKNQHVWWLVGDYIQANGINGDKLVAGHRPIALPRVGWDALVAVALVGTMITVMLAVEWAGERLSARHEHADRHRARHELAGRPAGQVRTVEDLTATMLLMHDVGYGGLLCLAAVGNGAIFDRYLWPLLLSAAIVVVHHFRAPIPFPDPGRPSEAAVVAAPRSTRLAAGSMLAALAVTTLLLTANSDAFDGARWRAATEAVRRGSPPIEVDAGFEWLGTVRSNLHCILVVPSPLPPGTGQEIATSAWRPLLVGPWSRLHIYRVAADGCPAG